MKTFILVFLLGLSAFADTPPPNTVKAKVFDGSGAQSIGNVSDSLKVNVTNTVPISGSISATQSGTWTVQQGTPPWTFTLPTNASTASSQTDGSQKSQIVDGSGNVWGPRTGSGGLNWMPVINLEAGSTGSAAAARTLQVGGSDGTNLRTLSTTAAGILNVNVNNTVPVSGTVAAAQSGAWTTGRTWTLLNTTDSVNIGNFPATTSVTQGTSPWVVSGTVTANAGTNLNTSALALDATLTAGTQKTMINNGANTAAVKAASTAAIATDPALVVAISPNNAVSVTGSGNFTVVQPTGANLHAVLDTTSTTAVTQATAANLNATVFQASGANLHVNVDSAPTTTVTGTVASTQSGTWNINNISGTISLPTLASQEHATAGSPSSVRLSDGTTFYVGFKSGDSIGNTAFIANAGTNLNTSALALSATQTNGTQKTQVVDGAGAVVGPVQTISGTNYAPVVLAASGTTAAAVPARTVQVGGSDGTNLRTISTDTSGNVNVAVVSTASASRSTVSLVRNVYSTTNVTTAAYVQLIASTADTINQIFIFDSSGQTLVLAVGAAASEVDKYQIVPGGNGLVNLTIPASSRVSVKALSATASSGELDLTFIK